MKCKTCGREQHYCTSCSSDNYMNSSYCTLGCFENGEEYKVFKKKLETLWESLTGLQRNDLWCLWDNGIFIDDLFEYVIDSIIIDERDD